MVKVVHFESSGPHAENVISEVTKGIETVSARPETRGFSHEEKVKESIRGIAERVPEVQVELPKDAPAEAKQGAVSSTNDTGSFPAYLISDDPASEDTKKAVEELVNLVFSKGLDEGVRFAKKYPPFIEDAFHDALTERLIPELKRRGILK